jgi:hypothetical protein
MRDIGVGRRAEHADTRGRRRAAVIALGRGRRSVRRTDVQNCLGGTRQRVVVGRGWARAMAAWDWRRTERHAALDGLLAGTLRFAWSRQKLAPEEGMMLGEEMWEGLLQASTPG